MAKAVVERARALPREDKNLMVLNDNRRQWRIERVERGMLACLFLFTRERTAEVIYTSIDLPISP